MIKGVIFDFDGVLVDSEYMNIEAAVKAFETIEKPLTPEEIHSIPGNSCLDFVPVFCRERGIEDPSQHKRLIRLVGENYDRLWPSIVTMFPNMQEIIEALLARGKILAVATTNRRRILELFFRKFNMNDKFSIAVTTEEVKKRKPDPEVYVLAIEKLGLSRENLIAVEDTSTGLSAAKAARLRCAVIPNEYTRDSDFSRADFLIKSAGELLKIIQNNRRFTNQNFHSTVDAVP